MAEKIPIRESFLARTRIFAFELDIKKPHAGGAKQKRLLEERPKITTMSNLAPMLSRRLSRSARL